MEYRDIAPRAAYSFLAVIIVAFIVLHAFRLSPSISDENTYFYIGNLVSQGYIPYKDFFYAHPPLNILLIAAIIKIAGFNLIMLKLIPVIASALTAIFLYLILEKVASRFAGLTGALLFLFSYQTLRVSTYVTGIETATLCMAIALYFLFSEKSRKYIYAGLLLGIAGITAFFSVIAAAVIAVVLLCQEPPVTDWWNATLNCRRWFLSMLRIPLLFSWFRLLNHHSKNGGILTLNVLIV